MPIGRCLPRPGRRRNTYPYAPPYQGAASSAPTALLLLTFGPLRPPAVPALVVYQRGRGWQTWQAQDLHDNTFPLGMLMPYVVPSNYGPPGKVLELLVAET